MTRTEVLQQVGEVLIESVVAAGRTEMTGKVLIAHMHIQVCRVVEVGGTKATQLNNTKQKYNQ